MTEIIKQTQTNIFGYTVLYVISILLCCIPFKFRKVSMIAAFFSFITSLIILYQSVQTKEYFFILYSTLILSISIKQILTSFFYGTITKRK
jgi:hypothetical protein